jgi:dsDNA-specific endonuclease/ATPase MutS2
MIPLAILITEDVNAVSKREQASVDIRSLKQSLPASEINNIRPALATSEINNSQLARSNLLHMS